MGLPEGIEAARRVIAPFSLAAEPASFSVQFTTVEHEQPIRLGDVIAQVWRTDHVVPSAGIRLEGAFGAVAYTGDTRPGAAVRELGHAAQLLICESTFLADNETRARRYKHMTAREAGEQAASCGAEHLALVHLDVAQGWAPETAREEAAQVFPRTISLPGDGDVMTI